MGRWYMDASYPSMVAHYLFKLGLIHGHAKIQYTLLSMVRNHLVVIEIDGQWLTNRTSLGVSLRSCRDT
jgi:hypothetical protein